MDAIITLIYILAIILLFLLAYLANKFITPIYYKTTRFFDRIFGVGNKNWQHFAESKNLSFKGDGFFSQPIVSGDFLGHFLSIRLARVASGQAEECTIFELKINHEFDSFAEKHGERDIMNRFLSTYNLFQSGIRLEITSEKILFKVKGYIKSLTELESISQQLVNLHEIFSDVCQLGGAAVDALLQDEKFQPITRQIIEAIASETKFRIKAKTSTLLCRKCLYYCSSHKVYNSFLKVNPHKNNFFDPIFEMQMRSVPKYYGCRQCRQSNNLIEGRSLAILDNLMTEKIVVKKNEIWVNWLIHRQPFDFYEILILQASDKEVEEFVMQVGNDTDEFRRSRYENLPCTISTDCKLSENTLRLLKHTFQSVKEI